jgi:hypothetical protein
VIKLEDGRSLPWIDENQNPFDGDWVARTKLLRQGDKIVDRGKDYNHSTFCDLVLSGLVGLSSPAAGTISVRPLVPPSWNWFRLSKAPCAGALVDVVYDRDGGRMGGRAGFEVFADGKSVYYSPELPRLAVFKR